jgi:hypothetical protein
MICSILLVASGVYPRISLYGMINDTVRYSFVKEILSQVKWRKKGYEQAMNKLIDADWPIC